MSVSLLPDIRPYTTRNAPDTKQEAEDVGLLLLVQLADVFVGTHLDG